MCLLFNNFPAWDACDTEFHTDDVAQQKSVRSPIGFEFSRAIHYMDFCGAMSSVWNFSAPVSDFLFRVDELRAQVETRYAFTGENISRSIFQELTGFCVLVAQHRRSLSHVI